ncbi:hypothetical protein CON65_14500 [Bacillus pseudomycoides]|uniref:Spore coat protein CotO n=1 Tax=Bacillus pseudomycoides TaxID=64104 RepID=A0AA91ZT11_9BACI|nr:MULTISPECIES: CotO family spore coat protein [Bacillus]PEB52873.1 hypothetical protein COO03_10465 [Bacillus sp. AFS098217]PED81942.1 hypothetical protein CON65_14500 [Bacillus pseudomycoides]PEU07926.1 hypothetical protein CN524_19645 [Bacillus sp. AFS019443]PEU16602.1 hypothetical protein CN525_16045 [Bacillus sp. AFS014408]PFW64186.1 hypothetical protein COL20_05650 [Bacillus sp. AFS075034]
MKRKQSKAKDKRSIIYIAQPTLNEANLNMQKTFIIKPENKLESVAEEEKEKRIDTKEEAISISEEEDVVIKAGMIEEVKGEDVIAEAEVIEEVKEQVEFTKEQQTDGEQLKDEQPETRVMAAKENKLFSNPIVAEKKNEEAGLSKGVQKRKSFKDMNNEEKLHFLIHKPKYIPKVRCQIKTVKENLTGYVLSYEEGYVAIKMMEKTKEIKVKFEDIVHIKMMGL